MRRFAPALLAACSLLSACVTVGPNYRAPTSAEAGVPPSYYGAPPEPSPADLASWWTQLDDPMLNSIVQRALAGNLDLAVAETRLRQARESIIQTRAQGLPQVTASGGVTQNVDAHGHTSRNFTIGGDASWEADLFGGVRRGVEAARAEAQGSEFDLAAVRVSLIGDVVTNYVRARENQQRLALAQETLKIEDDNLQIATWRRQAGLASSLDVEQARGERAQTAATIPTFENNFKASVFQLSVLSGAAPGTLMAEMQATGPVPNAPDQVAVGIPADTLRQRPDVRSAERTLAAETARIGVAEAQLHPDLRLTGNIGTAALSLGSLVDQITGSLFAGLTAPIFEGGKLRSQVRSQRAAAEGALATYRRTVLTALQDVENGLSAIQASKQRQADFAIAADAANNQAILARSEYRSGLTNFLTLLTAERALLSARDGLISSHADQTLAFVQLYRAFGGGWQPLTSPTGTRT